MITCTSPVAVMKAALELGRQLFADHAHKFSPHTFTQPPLIGRPSKHAPAGHYRRMMKDLFNAEVRAGTFGQRWQVETVNSTIKRNLDSALRARTPHRRSIEMLLRCVFHNIMVLKGSEP